MIIKINGRRYTYEPNDSFGQDAKRLEQKFLSLIRGGTKAVGKALAWLKKNTNLTSGSVRGVPTVMRDL